MIGKSLRRFCIRHGARSIFRRGAALSAIAALAAYCMPYMGALVLALALALAWIWRPSGAQQACIGALTAGLAIGLASQLALIYGAKPVLGQAAEPQAFVLEALSDSVFDAAGRAQAPARLIASRSCQAQTPASGRVKLYSGSLAARQGQRLIVTAALKESRLGRFYIQASENRIEGAGFSSSAFYWRAIARQRLDILIDSRLGGAAALFKAIFLGDRGALLPVQMFAFQRTGLGHLLALSGFHAALLVGALKKLLEPLPRAMQLVLMLASLACYLFLCGIYYSLARAAVMAAVLALLQFLRFEARFIDILGLSALILMAADPFAPQDLGFQLSFAAVAGIALFYGPVQAVLAKWPKALSGALAAGLSAQAGALPLQAWYFGCFFPIGLLLTAAAAGVLGGFLVLCAFCLVVPWPWLAALAQLYSQLVFKGLLWFAAAPRLSLPVGAGWFGLLAFAALLRYTKAHAARSFKL